MQLVNGLEKNETLETLSIEWNQIGTEGGCAVAGVIKNHKALKKLRLGLVEM